LELSLDDGTRKKSLQNADSVAAIGGDGGYGAFVSPTAAAAAGGDAVIGDSTTAIAGTNSKGNSRMSAIRQRSKSAPKSREDDGNLNVQYGELLSPQNSRRGGQRQRPQQQQRSSQHQQHQHQHQQQSRPSRSKSAGRQRTLSAGKLRPNVTPTKTVTGGTASGAGGSGRKGWGGFLRRKKSNNPYTKTTNINNNLQSSNGNNVCDYCQKVVRGKTRSQMYARLEYAYCSTDCTKRHGQALHAAKSAASGVRASTSSANVNNNKNNHTLHGSNLNFAESGFSSPPITPSAALIQSHHEQPQQPNQRGNYSANSNDDARQFFPSTAVAMASNSSSQDSILNGNSATASWSQSSKHCTAATAAAAAAALSSDFTTHAPIESHPTSQHGGGTTPEFNHGDYNDELSRQLRLAARQDELEAEERRYQSRQFLNAHPSSPGRYSNAGSGYSNASEKNVGEASPGRYAKYLKRMGANTNNNNNTNNSNGPSSGTKNNRRKYPMLKQSENSTQSTVESLSSCSQGASASAASHRQGTTTAGPLPPILTDRSVISNGSSKASSWGYLDVGTSFNSGGGGNDNIPKNSNNSHANNGGNYNAAVGGRNNDNSWTLKSKRTSSDVHRAFDGLSGWPYNSKTNTFKRPNNDFDTNKDNNNSEQPPNLEDTKTPRKGNLSSVHDFVDAVADNGVNNYNPNKDGNNIDQTRNHNSKNYERHLSSISSISNSPVPPEPPSSSLHAISEVQSFGVTESEKNINNYQPTSSFHFLAQKRGLRSTSTPPPLQTPPVARSTANGRDRAVKKVFDHHAVEDVVSIVSYYDDPSVDMLSSLATNDTLTTMSTSGGPRSSPRSQQQRRGSPTFGRARSGRTITTKTKPQNHQRQPQSQARRSDPQSQQQQSQQQRSDPPGNSIDELLKQGIHPHQHHGNVQRHFGRDPSFGTDPSYHGGLDPSFHGIDPEDEEGLMQIQEEVQAEEQHSKQQQEDEQRQHQDHHHHSQQRLSPQRQQHYHDAQSQRRLSPQKQQEQQKRSNPHYHPQQQQEREQTHQQSYHDQSQDIQNPPQLRNVVKEKEEHKTNPYNNQVEEDLFNNQQPHEEEGSFDFDVNNIEFPSRSKSLNDDDDDELTNSLLTGEDDFNNSINELPPLEKGDDDTVANTLDTVDLVAEVKRVWRHVQRYEKKKDKKKQLKEKYRQSRNMDSVDEHGTVENDEEEDGTIEGDDDELLRQFKKLQTATAPRATQHQRQHEQQQHEQQQHYGGDSKVSQHAHQQQQHYDGDSKYSDITSSTPHRVPPTNNINSGRGRASDRPATTIDGRLGKHIRSTSAHSRTHTPSNDIPASPGLDSNHAMTSHASTKGTEKDLTFLNEGVDDFFFDGQQVQQGQLGQIHQGQGQQVQMMDAYSRHRSRRDHHQQQSQQQPKSKKDNLVNIKLQQRQSRSSPMQTMQQYQSHSKSRSTEDNVDEDQELNNPQHNDSEHHLSKPYDMTKTRSTGTSFTQKTQKISNTTTLFSINNATLPPTAPAPSMLRAEMARKYMKQRGEQNQHYRSAPPAQQQQQQESYHQLQQHQQHHQQPHPSQLKHQHQPHLKQQHQQQRGPQRQQQQYLQQQNTATTTSSNISSERPHSKAIQNARERRMHTMNNHNRVP